MIPAPVTSSATTVPGSGIAVGFTEVRGGYMFPKSPAGAVTGGWVAGSGTGSAMTAGDSTTGSGTGSAMTGEGDSTTGSCTGSVMTGEGDSITGSCTGSAMTGEGDSTTGTGFLMTRGGGVVDCRLLLQAEEKFPGPHTSCAEAGGAAAR
jgi:hypothetical protein